MKLLSNYFMFCVILGTVLLSSCEKDEVNINRKVDLIGDWNISSWTKNGNSQISDEISGKFSWEEDCNGRLTVRDPDYETATSFTYSISNNKTLVSIDYSLTSFTDINNATITQYTSTNFEFTGTDANGNVIVMELIK